MPCYSGEPLPHPTASIGAPPVGGMDPAAVEPGMRYAFMHWWDQAQANPDVLYFAIYAVGDWAGQILLHDIDRTRRESLIAYHLFDTALRGRGIGTAALGLLRDYAAETLGLNRLVVITARDNLASPRVAEKCGFRYTGPSREDPIEGMVFTWER